MALDEAVVLGDARFLEAGPLGDEVANIGVDIDTHPAGEALEVCRKPQQAS